MHVGAIVLEGEARLSTGRELVNEASGGVGDVDDGFAVAGHRDRLVELAGAVAVGAPGVDVLDGRLRRLLSGGGLCWARTAGDQDCDDKHHDRMPIDGYDRTPAFRACT